MPITYPRTLPAGLIISASEFKPMFQTVGPERTLGGKVQVVQTGEPYWRCYIESSEVDARQYLTLHAWIATLRGGMKTFLAHDQARPFPQFYRSGGEASVLALTRAGGGAFNGTFTITSFPSVYEIRSVTPGSLRAPANLALRVGDYIGIEQSSRYSLHMVVEDVTADASGNFTTGNTITVEPNINTTFFAANAVARIIRPLAEFVLEGEVGGQPNTRTTKLTFSAVSKVPTDA
jgi:hypothetical protein